MHYVRFIDGKNDTLLPCIDEFDAMKDKFYKNVVNVAKDICRILKIDMPEISLYPGKQQDVDFEYAMSLGPNEVISPKKPLIIFFMQVIKEHNKTPDEFMGYLAHELRHTWQAVNYGIKKNPARGIQTISDKDEIDADAFAICYLTELMEISFKKAANLVCGELKDSSPYYYLERINKAKELHKAFLAEYMSADKS